MFENQSSFVSAPILTQKIKFYIKSYSGPDNVDFNATQCRRDRQQLRTYSLHNSFYTVYTCIKLGLH